MKSLDGLETPNEAILASPITKELVYCQLLLTTWDSIPFGSSKVTEPAADCRLRETADPTDSTNEKAG